MFTKIESKDEVEGGGEENEDPAKQRQYWADHHPHPHLNEEKMKIRQIRHWNEIRNLKLEWNDKNESRDNIEQTIKPHLNEEEEMKIKQTKNKKIKIKTIEKLKKDNIEQTIAHTWRNRNWKLKIKNF